MGALGWLLNLDFAGGGEEAVVVPDSEGLQYTAAKNRMHYVADENRTHYTADVDRMHYTVRDES